MTKKGRHKWSRPSAGGGAQNCLHCAIARWDAERSVCPAQVRVIITELRHPSYEVGSSGLKAMQSAADRLEALLPE